MLLRLGDKPVARSGDRKYQIWNAIRVSWMVILAIGYVAIINAKPSSTAAMILVALGLGFAGFGLFDLIWSRFVGPVAQMFVKRRWFVPTRLLLFLGGAALALRGISLL